MIHNDVIQPEGPLHDAICTHLTEYIQPGDPRAQDPRMKEPISAEIRDLVRRGTFKVVTRAEIPRNANLLSARFVLAIKHKITGEVRFKARYVVAGHRDRLKSFLVLGSQTRQPISVRILVALAAIFNFKI